MVLLAQVNKYTYSTGFHNFSELVLFYVLSSWFPELMNPILEYIFFFLSKKLSREYKYFFPLLTLLSPLEGQ